MCRCQLIWRLLQSCCAIFAVKRGPQSEEMSKGILNQGMIWFNKMLKTLAVFVWAGNASGHAEKVSVKGRRYLYAPFLGNSEKSTCQCCPGCCPLSTVPSSTLVLVCGLALRRYFTPLGYLLYTRVQVASDFCPYQITM